jgi:hypothetical protein
MADEVAAETSERNFSVETCTRDPEFGPLENDLFSNFLWISQLFAE